jgi:hypothetical protein
MASIEYQIALAEKKRSIEPSFFFPLTNDLSFSSLNKYLMICLELEEFEIDHGLINQEMIKDFRLSDIHENFSSIEGINGSNLSNDTKNQTSLFSSPSPKIASKKAYEPKYYSSSKKIEFKLSSSPILEYKSPNRKIELFRNITQSENEENAINVQVMHKIKTNICSEKRFAAKNLEFDFDQENCLAVKKHEEIKKNKITGKEPKRKRIQFWGSDFEVSEEVKKKVRI